MKRPCDHVSKRTVLGNSHWTKVSPTGGNQARYPDNVKLADQFNSFRVAWSPNED